MLEGSMSTQRKGIFHEGMESGVHVCVAQAPVDHGTCSCICWHYHQIAHVFFVHPTLWGPMGCSLPGSPVPEIPQAKILKWDDISLNFRGSFQPRDWIPISCIGRQVLYHWATREFPYHQGGPQTFICQIRVKRGKNMGFFFKAQFMLNMTELIWNVSLPLKKKLATQEALILTH